MNVNVNQYQPMKTNSLPWLFALMLAGTICAVPLSAGAANEKTVVLPRSHVEAIDFTNMTFTVTMKETNLTVHFTAETRFFLNGKPAVSKDMEVADHVKGTLHKPAQGLPEAVRIHIQKLAPK